MKRNLFILMTLLLSCLLAPADIFAKLDEQKLFELFSTKKEIPLKLLYTALEGDQLTLRAYAASYLGEFQVREAVPQLVKAMKDESCHIGAKYKDSGMACTRYRAFLSLKRITKKNFPFSWNASQKIRNKEVAKWENWVNSKPKELLSLDGDLCTQNKFCENLDCSKYNGPIKSGYRPECVDKIRDNSDVKVCKCMCRGCH